MAPRGNDEGREAKSLVAWRLGAEPLSLRRSVSPRGHSWAGQGNLAAVGLEGRPRRLQPHITGAETESQNKDVAVGHSGGGRLDPHVPSAFPLALAARLPRPQDKCSRTFHSTV